ncbi:MAG TPA: MaoC family dehydratase [Candidatus Hydrogenedentes bacterium]|nr:MaoC family dehydratase [Candidatus Hydrogenedentota bacterium]HRK36425.1 MaoC family dehydratase [Candidatus Hydrogenedentota bacterium]
MSQRQLSISDIPAMVGQDIGVSDWHAVTQEEINAFADATHDHQWIHVDVERAKRESPFGGPIAHGYYTLSIVPYLMEKVWTITGASAGLNYGLNKLRFPSPVPAGSRVRLHVKLNNVDDVPGGIQVNVTLTIEVEGTEKPALVAEGLYRFYA